MVDYLFDLAYFLYRCSFFEQDEMTALMIAASMGHHKCVSILVANGAKVNKTVNLVEIQCSCFPLEMYTLIY